MGGLLGVSGRGDRVSLIGKVLLQVGSTRKQAKQALFNQDFATLSADARALQYPAACTNDMTQGNIPLHSGPCKYHMPIITCVRQNIYCLFSLLLVCHPVP